MCVPKSYNLQLMDSLSLLNSVSLTKNAQDFIYIQNLFSATY